jgi:hypothetical protein
MKQTDLRPCVCCGKGVMHSNGIAFFRVQVDHMVVNLQAVQRQAGLEMVLAGNAALAYHMGPQDDIALEASTSRAVVCQDCFLTVPAASLWERMSEPDHDVSNRETSESSDA